MSIPLDELKQEAAKLSDAERAELALSLIESLEEVDIDENVMAAWAAEAERRAGQVERGEVKLVPGDQVFERLRRRLE